jgi:hypothetical protein
VPVRVDAMYEINEKSIHLMRGVIGYYLDRQQLVARAMLDVNPQPLYMCGTHVLGIEIEPHVNHWLRKMEMDDDFQLNWHHGIWDHEWQYEALGIGCTLTHLQTGEPIAWNAPHLDTYDEAGFMNHLNWRIAQTVEPENVESHTRWLQSIYQYMLDQRLIVLNFHQKWKLNQ